MLYICVYFCKNTNYFFIRQEKTTIKMLMTYFSGLERIKTDSRQSWSCHGLPTVIAVRPNMKGVL